MAQSNYNIPNDSAPAVRAQLNAVFQSIATNNSGSSAPTTTFAHQWWYDTTTNILKQRNAADSAWINIGTFDQTGGTFTPAGIVQLTQTQAEDPTSTVFGTVSGQRLAQAAATGLTDLATGAPGAPSLVGAGWLPWDMTTNNLSAEGEIWSFAADGSFTTLDAPDFEPGFDYLFWGLGLTGGVYNAAIVFDGPTTVTGLWTSNLSGSPAASFFLTVAAPRLARSHFRFDVSGSQGNFSDFVTGWGPGGGFETRVRRQSGANRIKNIQFTRAGTALTAGQIRMMRRRHWGAE